MPELPILLAELADEIGKHLPKLERRRWPGRVAASITEKAELSRVWPCWVMWLLRSECPSVRSERGWEDTPLPCGEHVAALYELQLSGVAVQSDEWADAAERAWETMEKAAAARERWEKALKGAVTEEDHKVAYAEFEMAGAAELQAQAAAAAAEAAAQQDAEDQSLVGEQTWAPTVAWAAAELSAWAAALPEMVKADREASYIRQANQLLVLLRDDGG